MKMLTQHQYEVLGRSTRLIQDQLQIGHLTPPEAYEKLHRLGYGDTRIQQIIQTNQPTSYRHLSLKELKNDGEVMPSSLYMKYQKEHEAFLHDFGIAVRSVKLVKKA